MVVTVKPVIVTVNKSLANRAGFLQPPKMSISLAETNNLIWFPIIRHLAKPGLTVRLVNVTVKPDVINWFTVCDQIDKVPNTAWCSNLMYY